MLRLRLEDEKNKVSNILRKSNIESVLDRIDRQLDRPHGFYLLVVEDAKALLDGASAEDKKACSLGDSAVHHIYGAYCLNMIEKEKKYLKTSAYGDYPADAHNAFGSVIYSDSLDMRSFLVKTIRGGSEINSISADDEDFLIGKLAEAQEKADSHYKIAEKLVELDPKSCKIDCSPINFRLR